MSSGNGIRSRPVRRALAMSAYPLTLATGVLSAWYLLYPLALPVYWILLPLTVAFLVVGVLERLAPYRRHWNEAQGDLATDAFYILFNYGLREGSGILFKVGLVTALAYLPAGYALQSFWPQHWHPLLQVALAILVLDFFEYWFHRASHQLPFLWRFHAIHHSPKRLYFLNAARFHFVDWLVLNAIEVGVLFLIGVDPVVIALAAVFVQIHGLFQHANIESRLGPLNYVFSTAELHRWHHSKLARESDTNFGNNVILWDLLFGTFFLPRDRQVGVLGLLNAGYPQDFAGQALAPFRRRAQDKPADYRQRRGEYLRAVEEENRQELAQLAVQEQQPMNTKPLARGVAGMLAVSILLAGAAGMIREARAEEALPPEALVKTVVDVYRYASRRLAGKPQAVRHKLLIDLVNEKIMPTIDYPHVTREIFTNHWATLEEMGRSEEAVTAVEDAFRARYVQSLKAFTDLKIRIFSAQIEGDRARVHVKVDAFNTFGNDVYFHRAADGNWKVVDVHIVGLSIVDAVRQAVDKGVEAFGYEKVFEYMRQESEKAGS